MFGLSYALLHALAVTGFNMTGLHMYQLACLHLPFTEVGITQKAAAELPNTSLPQQLAFAPFQVVNHPCMYCLPAFQVYEQVTQSRNRLSTKLSAANKVRICCNTYK